MANTNQIGDELPAVLRKYDITPLPTKYRGIEYRSRTEARWAVFFDALNLRHEYEREGYDLGGVWYLPDFWMPELNAWIEIKGEEPNDDECDKSHRLAEASGKTAFVFFGSFVEPVGDYDPPSAYALFPDGGADYGYLWCECPDCHSVGIQFDGRSDRLGCKQGRLTALGILNDGNGCPRHSLNRDKAYNYQTEKLSRAYAAARAARFIR